MTGIPLVQRFDHGLGIEVILLQNGRLSARVGGRTISHLKGLPSQLKSEDIPKAIHLLQPSQSSVHWDQRILTFIPKLVGGGAQQSTPQPAPVQKKDEADDPLQIVASLKESGSSSLTKKGLLLLKLIEEGKIKDPLPILASILDLFPFLEGDVRTTFAAVVHLLVDLAVIGKNPAKNRTELSQRLGDIILTLKEGDLDENDLRYALEVAQEGMDTFPTLNPATEQAFEQLKALPSPQHLSQLLEVAKQQPSTDWYSDLLFIRRFEPFAKESIDIAEQIEPLFSTSKNWYIVYGGVQLLLKVAEKGYSPSQQQKALTTLFFYLSSPNWRIRAAVAKGLLNLCMLSVQEEQIKEALRERELSENHPQVRHWLPASPTAGILQAVAKKVDTLATLEMDQTDAVELAQEETSLNLPYPPIWSAPNDVSHFVGRRALLDEIGKRFNENANEPLVQVVVAGLGGVGKTTLLTKYVYRHRDRYNLIWWISGERPLEDLRALGEALELAKPADQGDQIIGRVIEYLEHNRGWLLVIDNGSPQVMAPYLPSKGGHLLFSSRNPHSKESLIVDLFHRNESLALLSKITRQTNLEGADKVAEALGHLPLALTQAAAYMAATQTSFSDYHGLFISERPALWEDENAPKDYSHTVATTWKISVKMIEQQLPEALDFLYAAAYLSPDNIPRVIFETEGVNPLEQNNRLHKLQQYSLFSSRKEGAAFFVHRLVQTVTRDYLKGAEETRVIKGLAKQFRTCWTYDPRLPGTWTRGRELFFHLKSYCSHAEKSSNHETGVINFLNSLGSFCTATDINLPLAVELHKKALTIGLSLEANYRTVVNTTIALSHVYSTQEEYPQAIHFLTEALEHLKRYGEYHPDRATVLEGLWDLYNLQGDIEKGKECLSQALVIREWASKNKGYQPVAERLEEISQHLLQHCDSTPIGTDDYSYSLEGVAKLLKNQIFQDFQKSACLEMRPNPLWVSRIKNKMIFLKDEKGGFSSFAISSLMLAFDYIIEAGRLRQLSEKPEVEHAHALLHNIFSEGCQHGFSSQAIEQYYQILTTLEKTYGAQGVNMVEPTAYLALIYLSLKAFDKAEETFLAAKKIAEKHQEADPRPAAMVLQMMVKGHKMVGNFVKAEDALLESLQLLQKVYQEPHPKVAQSLEELGSLYSEELKDNRKAIEYYKKALEINEAIYGRTHSAVATVLVRLGTASRSSEDANSEAISYHEGALQILQSVAPTSHYLRDALDNLAFDHFFADSYDKAIYYFERSLAWREEHQKWGDQEDLYGSLQCLVGAYSHKGDLTNCAAYLRSAIERFSAQDEKGIHYFLYLQILGQVYLAQNNLEEARKCLETCWKNAVENPTPGFSVVSLENDLDQLAMVYMDGKEYDVAFSLLNMLLELSKIRHGPRHPKIGSILGRFALLNIRKEDIDKAVEFYREAIELLSHHDPSADEPEYRLQLLFASLQNLSKLYDSAGNKEAAIECLKKALPHSPRNLRESDPDYAETCFKIGIDYFQKDLLEEAQEHLMLAHDSFRKIYGENSPHVSQCMFYLGRLYKLRHENTQAIECFNKSRKIMQQAGKGEDLQILPLLDALTEAYREATNYQLAIETAQTVLRIVKNQYGNRHRLTALRFKTVGILYYQNLDHLKAIEYYQKSLASFKSIGEEEGHEVIILLNNIGIAQCSSKRISEGIATLLQTHEMLKKTNMTSDPFYRPNLKSLASAYRMLGDETEARKYTAMADL